MRRCGVLLLLVGAFTGPLLCDRARSEGAATTTAPAAGAAAVPEAAASAVADAPSAGTHVSAGGTALGRAQWDLLAEIAASATPPKGISLALRGAHGQTRAVAQMSLPGELRVPVSVPPQATLVLGHAIQAAAFMSETPELAEAVEFEVVFVDSARDGGAGEPTVSPGAASAGAREHVLLERTVDIRSRPEDRRWFDERIDLSGLAGRSGELVLRVRPAGDGSRVKDTMVYWSTPRIVVPSEPDGLNLLLITIDCLRADHVGAYGYTRPTTPTLDRLAAEGVRFANAFSNAPMTLPSIPQLLTSRLFPTKDHTIVTAPIARAGIASAAIINNAWIPLWLSQGGHAQPPGTFDRLVSGDLDAAKITERAIAWLTEHRDDRFALYLHYLDAHTPYHPPASYVEMFADPDYGGAIGTTFEDSDGADKGRYDRADRTKIMALYDASLRYIDDQIARLLAVLRENGQLDRTVVIVSADHGEEFWDHGRFFHGQSLYDELLRIPLIVRLPGAARAGTVIERPVALVDVAPSLLDWAGLERPDSFEGESLRAAIENRSGLPPRDLLATATQAQFPARFAIRRGPLKVIESLDTSRSEFYDLATDPREKSDLAAAPPAGAADLSADLEQARTPLRARGYQIQVVGPRAGTAEVVVDLQSEARSGTFLAVDRREGDVRPRLTVSSDAEKLRAEADVGAAGTGFRFDRLLAPRNLDRIDRVKVAVQVDGEQVDIDEIRLGPEGKPAESDVVAISDASLVASETPSCPAPEAGARVCLWRFAGEATAPLPEIHDESVREKLRALGYIQ